MKLTHRELVSVGNLINSLQDYSLTLAEADSILDCTRQFFYLVRLGKVPYSAAYQEMNLPLAAKDIICILRHYSLLKISVILETSRQGIWGGSFNAIWGDMEDEGNSFRYEDGGEETGKVIYLKDYAKKWS